ncbi:hypothetical protein ACTMS0_18685 [Micromonospora sp. H33]|uniref:hypothetical protein n=1 Tax=Micromonospora sp. H33 TaxID=3452215 RepID=UPI003F88A623
MAVPWRVTATVTRLTLTGEPRAKTAVELDVPAYSSVVRALPTELARPEEALDPLAEVDEALVTLLPGESATFTVRTGGPLDIAALTSRPVLRCVND